MTNPKEELTHFAKQITKGIELVKNKQEQKALQILAPFVHLMKESGTNHIRLFSYYAIAELRTGDIDGFVESYLAVKEMPAATKEEEDMQSKLEGLFHSVFDELNKN
ncbi:hypothetical protein [Alkalihalobacillus sp. 1P02AB]|uniref:hypothetical protein n=1 Tax=Alkalihalobacillus sp. 1P02AB TaxID=3132260 RepID=UPI0039A6398F